MAVVVDASVAVAWCLPLEIGSAQAQGIAMRLLDESAIVPPIFWYEIRNALVRAERHRRIDPDESAHFLDQMADLIEEDYRRDEMAVLDLARQHRLTVYDAAYLETAMRRQAVLATFDQELAAAARIEGITNLVS